MKNKIIDIVKKYPYGIHYSEIARDVLKLKNVNKQRCRKIVKDIIGDDILLKENQEGYWRLVDERGSKERLISDTVFVIVDIETTGGNPSKCHIIEIGACKIFRGEVISRFATLIKPPQSIPNFITFLTGIDDKLVSSAPKPQEALYKFSDYLNDAVFVAHNANFDFKFIERDFKRYLRKKLENIQICTIKLLRKLFPQIRFYNLDTISSYFEIPHYTRHRAEDDVWITAEVFKIILNKLAEKNISTLEEMMALQVGGSFLEFNFDLNIIRNFPQVCGFLEIKDKDDKLIYRTYCENLRQDTMNFIFRKGGKRHNQILSNAYSIEIQPD